MLDFWAGPVEQGKGRRAARSGDAAWLHRDRRRLAAAASSFVRLLGPRAPCRARRAARRVPAVRDRYGPRVSDRPRHRRRRGVGHRPGAPGCLGRRDPDRGGGRPLLSAATRRTRDYVSWYVVAGELDGDKMARNARELDRYFKQNYRRHGGRIPGPRLRAVRRRDSAAVRLDGPAAPQHAEGNRMRVDAAVGQFLLVARSRGLAGEVDGVARQLAAGPRRPAGTISAASGWKRTRSRSRCRPRK